MKTPKSDFFETGILKGTIKPDLTLRIPYKGNNLSGNKVLNLITRWESNGVIENDTSDVLQEISKKSKQVLSSVSDKVFVLLGAISEMGPLQCLLSWGATI